MRNYQTKLKLKSG